MTHEDLLRKRDAKTIPHLEQYAPVWITDEKIIEEDDAVQFNVIFRHNQYQWVTRRYRYDAFNNVLYHKGQRVLDEAEVLELEEKAPYITRIVTDTPNAYGG